MLVVLIVSVINISYYQDCMSISEVCSDARGVHNVMMVCHVFRDETVLLNFITVCQWTATQDRAVTSGDVWS